MSALTFRLTAEPPERLDLSHLTPSRLAGLDRGRIERLTIGTTREGVCVADVFALDGTETEELRFEGGSTRFDRLGAGLDSGAIQVEGDAGYHCGKGMSGGTLRVSGSVAACAGVAMSGGRLEISGDAGDFLGGADIGETTGMSGGVIVVDGSAGARTGDRMRRGTILVRGDTGPDAASRMVAGTIVIGGRAAGTPGRLMKRGTVVLSGGAERIAPTFMDNGSCDLLILKLMADALTEELGSVPFDGTPMRRLGGDMATMGLGEIFVR